MTQKMLSFVVQKYTIVKISNKQHVQCESKKSPPEDLWQFFKNGWEFFNQILRAYYEFLSTLDYEFLFNYLQL